MGQEVGAHLGLQRLVAAQPRDCREKRLIYRLRHESVSLRLDVDARHGLFRATIGTPRLMKSYTFGFVPLP